MAGNNGQCCIVYGLNGLRLRMAIFPLKRLLALQVGVAADADTVDLLARSSLPAENLGRGSAWLEEVRRRVNRGQVLFMVAPAEDHPIPIQLDEDNAGVPWLRSVEELVQAVSALGTDPAVGGGGHGVQLVPGPAA